MLQRVSHEYVKVRTGHRHYFTPVRNVVCFRAKKMADQMNPKVKCPTCKKEGEWFAGPYGPFCSKRCKLVDLGKWLGEEHAISEPLRPEHFKEYEELPPGKELDEAE